MLPGCPSLAGSFDIIVTIEPTVSASADVTICNGSDVTITASATPADAGNSIYLVFRCRSYDYSWHGSESCSYTYNSPTTYYVTADINGCVSSVAADVEVTLSEPAAPIGIDATVCESLTILTDYELSATCTASNVNWYDAATGGTLLLANSTTYTPASPTTLSDGTNTYYAECEDAGGCISTRTAVTLIIDAKPDAPIIADETICENGTATDILLIGAATSSYTLVGPTGSAGPLTATSITDGDLQELVLMLRPAGTYSFSLSEISDASCVSDLELSK